MSTTPRRRYDNSRRQADAEARQRRIVEAATTLFMDQGFAGTSIDQIAARGRCFTAVRVRHFRLEGRGVIPGRSMLPWWVTARALYRSPTGCRC